MSFIGGISAATCHCPPRLARLFADEAGGDFARVGGAAMLPEVNLLLVATCYGALTGAPFCSNNLSNSGLRG